MALLELRGVVVRYGQLTAVHGMDLTIDRGEVAVLLGSNGAGKSSTLNAISGIVPTAAGEIVFDGKPVHRLPSHLVSRAGVVQVPEGRRIIGPLTVQENLDLGAYSLRDKARRRELATTVRELFPELDALTSRPAGLLSGGEQQMVAFGRALMADPVVLMLDEPSMGLAPVVLDRVIEAIHAIAARGISILMVEQNAAAAFEIATTVHVLEQGELTLQGPVGEVRSSPLVLRAFLGIEAELPTTQEATGASSLPPAHVPSHPTHSSRSD